MKSSSKCDSLVLKVERLKLSPYLCVSSPHRHQSLNTPRLAINTTDEHY